MPILDAIKDLPKYASYEADIKQVLRELFNLTAAQDGDEDSLILRRFEHLFAEMDAEQVYHFLGTLKSLIITPNSGSGSRPAIDANSARGRALKLLDRFCTISAEPLIGLSGRGVDNAGIVDLSKNGSRLNAALLQANKIYADTQGFWYQSPYDVVLAAGAQSLATSDFNNKVLEITDNDNAVDFTFINNYLEFSRLVMAYPMILSLPSQFLIPANVKKIKTSNDVLSLCIHALKTHPKYATYSAQIDSQLAALSHSPEIMGNFIALAVAYPHTIALNHNVVLYVEMEKIKNLPTVFLNSSLGISLVNVLGVQACVKLYESSASKDLLQLYHLAVTTNLDYKFNSVYLESYISEFRQHSKLNFMDHYAEASQDFIKFVLPLAEEYNLIRIYDYAKYPALTSLRQVKAEEAVNSLVEISAVPNFDAAKQRLLAGDFSNNSADLSQTQIARDLLEELNHKMSEYGTKDNVRLRAKAQLTAAMAQGLHAVTELLRMPSFKADAGYAANHRKRRLLKRVVFSDVCDAFMVKANAYTQDRNTDRSRFVRAVCADGPLLKAMLTNNETYQQLILDPKLLSEIYSSASSEKKALFVQAIYDLRNAQTFPELRLSNGTRLTFQAVSQMVNVPKNVNIEEKSSDHNKNISKAWNAFNKLRHDFQLESIIPSNTVYAKAGSAAAIEELTAEDKHQLIDSDIAVGEDYLRTKYKHLFRNKVSNESNKPIAHNVPDFYFMPVGNYMLLDPAVTGNANFGRFREFKKAFPEYLNSAQSSVNASSKPIVFLGAANVSNNHYIAYFVTKKRDGTVQVVTLDPSPRVYPAGTRSRSGELLDGKDKAVANLKRMFDNIFPGCEFLDLDITQQLLQRDCGFNALQTLDDVLASIGTPESLLEIDAMGAMKIKTDNLTVNGNLGSGLNYSTGTYYYQKQLQQVGKQNRQAWANRFKAHDTYRVYIKTREVNSIDVPDEILPLEYSYLQNTLGQQHADAGDENISRLFGSMISLPIWDSIESRFVREFQEPTAEELANIANAVTTLLGGQNAIDAMLPAAQDLTVILKDLARAALYQHVVRALVTKFKSYLHTDRLKIAEQDTAQTLHNRFIGHDNVKAVYERLSNAEKSSLQADVNTYTHEQLDTLKDNYCEALARRIITIFKNQANSEPLAAVLTHFSDENAAFSAYDKDTLKQALSTHKILSDELDAWSSDEAQAVILSIVNTAMSMHYIEIAEHQVDTVLPLIKISDRVSAEVNAEIIVKTDDQIFESMAEQLGVVVSPFFRNLANEKLTAKKAQFKNTYDLAKNQVRDLTGVLQDASEALNLIGSIEAAAAAQNLQSYIEVLARTLANIVDWSRLSIREIEDKTQRYSRAINDYKMQFVLSLFSLYTIEDVMPRQVTQIARKAIAKILNLSLPPYPSNEDLIAFDRQVKSIMVDNRMGDFASSLPVELPVVPQITPMLTTYGKKLSRALLIKLLNLWKISYRSQDTNTVGDTPTAIKELMTFVNTIPASIADEAAIPQSMLDKLLLLAQAQVKISDFAMIATIDPTRKIFLSIYATFNLVQPVVIFEQKQESAWSADADAPLAMSINSVEHILNLYTGKDKHDVRNPEDFGAVSSTQLVESSKTGLVKRLFGGVKTKFDFSPAAMMLQNMLQSIRGRHQQLSNEVNFDLDYTDLQWLMDFLARSNVIVAGAKLVTSTQRLYWAIASVVSDELQKHGVYKTAAQIFGIHADVKLKSMRVPDSISQLYGFEDGATVNCIPPQDLICLDSGYFLDAGWMTAPYESSGDLINPYTKTRLTAEEVATMMNQSPATKEKLLAMHEVRMVPPIEKHIDALIKLVNGLLDPRGTYSEPTSTQHAAWDEFHAYLKLIGPGKAATVMNFEVAPLSSSTSADLRTSRRVRLETILTPGTCVHVISKCIVPLIYQYKGDLDFLTSSSRDVYLNRYSGLGLVELQKYFPRKQLDAAVSKSVADKHIEKYKSGVSSVSSVIRLSA
jgi:hypothetical protein